MYTGTLILNVCLLIALVVTNPIPQEILIQGFPATYYDQNVYKSSLADLPIGAHFNIPYFLAPGQIASISNSQIIQQNDQSFKLFYDIFVSSPGKFDNSNKAGFPYGIQNHRPNIINNYIKLHPKITNSRSNGKENDNNSENNFYNPNICTQVKKNVCNDKIVSIAQNNNPSSQKLTPNINKNEQLVNISQEKFNVPICDEKVLSNITSSNCNNQEENIKILLKRSLPEKDKSKGRHQELSNEKINLKELSVNENGSNRVNKKRSSRKEIKNKKHLDLSTNSFNNNNKVSNKEHKNNSHKTISTTKKSRRIPKNKDEKQREIKTSELTQIKKSNIKNNTGNKKKIDQKNMSKNVLSSSTGHQFPNMHSNNMYQYIDSILSNYQLTNFNNEFPYNYNNFYPLSQSSIPRDSINNSRNKNKPHRRRKQSKLLKRKLNKKRIISKSKQTEKVNRKPSAGSINEINTVVNNLDTNAPYISLKTTIIPRLESNESERLSKQKNMTSPEEADNSFISSIGELSINNNSESSQYNSYPSFILGMEDTVPIIFENGFIDDYYPDFTADNEALHLIHEETRPRKYYGDKYHYVSNKNYKFEDYVKTRKHLAMQNINKNPNLFFSETNDNRDIAFCDQADEREIESTIQFQSPPFLDNPDFRTRKIDSNEKYEPYYHHNVFQDPDEDFDKYYLDNNAVYPTSVVPKNSVKNKLCNDIDDGLTSKWKKGKESNVETVYARSKLAKYGLTL